MKHLSFIHILIIVFFNFSFIIPLSSNTVSDQGPLLVVVIMVKNEEAVIKPTLEMYCKADPTGTRIGYFVYDTGEKPWSLTMQKARDLFNEYGISNYIITQEPFVDFSTSRNRALRYAEKYFANATFLLMPDAEWYLNDVFALLDFCQEAKDESYTEYLIRIMSSTLDFYTPRLIRAHKGICFEGVVHEVIHTNKMSTMMGPTGVYFYYPEQPEGLQRSMERWHRDLKMLFAEYMKNPLVPRTTFYLAQTYDCLNDLQNAYCYYKKRTQLSGFVEEDYMAHYRLGFVSERMINSDGTSDWSLAFQHYIDAFMLRPKRAEPLIRIALHYINNDIYDLAFFYAYLACQLPYPDDILFIEKELYERVRYEIFAKAALHVELEIPEKVCIQAFKKHEKEMPMEKFFLTQAFLG